MVTRSPADPQPAHPDGEVLDELGDDAIVAQQSTPHAPQPRVQVAQEARSVVIADDAERPNDPRLDQQFPKFTSSNEPTVVIRDRRALKQLKKLSYPPAPSQAGPRWVTAAIWFAAAVLALGSGAVLALLMRTRASPVQQIEPPPVVAEARPAQPVAKPALSLAPVPPPPAPSNEPIDLDEQHVSASELPIEQPAPATSARPKAARPAKQVPAKDEDIPSGI